MGRAFEVRKQAMAKTAAVKTKVYSKFGREIYVAAKGGIDPDANLELKRIIEKAKKNQVPADIIKRAIEKAKGGSDENYNEVRYEGFGPGNVLYIVECLTDNVNRTISEVRNCFTKTGGKLGVSGSVLHMFFHYCVFELKGISEDEALEILINEDVEVENIKVEEDILIIYGLVSNYHKIKEVLSNSNKIKEFLTDEIMWIAANEVNIYDKEIIEKNYKLIEMLNNLDDVKDVYHNLAFEE